MWHKGYNVTSNYPWNYQYVNSKVCLVPNTYFRVEGNELFLIHFPTDVEDEEVENKWTYLCDNI